MKTEIVRRLTPEEEELARKREDLAAVRAALAERELELADFRSQLAMFQGRYMRQVGVPYAELDDWQARIAELQARSLSTWAPNPCVSGQPKHESRCARHMMPRTARRRRHPISSHRRT